MAFASAVAKLLRSPEVFVPPEAVTVVFMMVTPLTLTSVTVTELSEPELPIRMVP